MSDGEGVDVFWYWDCWERRWVVYQFGHFEILISILFLKILVSMGFLGAGYFYIIFLLTDISIGKFGEEIYSAGTLLVSHYLKPH